MFAGAKTGRLCTLGKRRHMRFNLGRMRSKWPNAPHHMKAIARQAQPQDVQPAEAVAGGAAIATPTRLLIIRRPPTRHPLTHQEAVAVDGATAADQGD